MDSTPRPALLLDLDPELGGGIESQDWELARQAIRAELIRVDPGVWSLPTNPANSGNIIGLIVNDGMISRETALSQHVAFELLTPGDVLLLAPPADDLDLLGGRVTVTALSPVTLIVLSKAFVHAAASWPGLLTNLHRRLEAQRRWLAIQGLAAHLPRAADRVLLTLWLLADRCGRVTPEGIVLPLAVSHEAVGRLAAARRPTITLALRDLETAGCVHRRPDGHLTLTPAARRRVQELANASTRPPPLGPGVVVLPAREASRPPDPDGPRRCGLSCAAGWQAPG